MNSFGLLHIRFGRISRCNMGDETREAVITRFAEMDLIPVPTEISLVSKMRLQIRRRADGEVRWGQIVFVAETQHTIIPEELLCPDFAQALHSGQTPQSCWCLLVPNLVE